MLRSHYSPLQSGVQMPLVAHLAMRDMLKALPLALEH